jgi:hypothetical protein
MREKDSFSEKVCDGVMERKRKRVLVERIRERDNFTKRERINDCSER